MDKNRKYIWKASCSDGGWDDRSSKAFDTIEECYNDMREAALHKMTYNTDYKEIKDEPYDTQWICYFHGNDQTKITLNGAGCVYTYFIQSISDYYRVVVTETHFTHNDEKECLETETFIFKEDAFTRFRYFCQKYEDRNSKAHYNWWRKCEDLSPKREGVMNHERISWWSGAKEQMYDITLERIPI